MNEAAASTDLSRHRVAWRVTIAYFCLATVWILSSDLVLYKLGAHLPAPVETSLGLLFTAVTSVLLYLFVYRQFRPFSEAARHQRAEDQLAEAQERYRALFERSRDCVFLCDLRGHLLDANRAALQLLGYGREELAQLPLRRLLRTEDMARARAALANPVTTGAQANQYRLRRKDDTEVLVETSFSAVMRGSQPVAVQCIARDVTDRHRFEQRLRESEQRFSVMVWQSISGFYIIDSGVFCYANRRFAEIFGYAMSAEIVGLRPSDLIAERDRARVTENIRRLAGTTDGISFSFTGVRKDGSEVVISTHGALTTYAGHPVIVGLLQEGALSPSTPLLNQ